MLSHLLISFCSHGLDTICLDLPPTTTQRCCRVARVSQRLHLFLSKSLFSLVPILPWSTHLCAGPDAANAHMCPASMEPLARQRMRICLLLLLLSGHSSSKTRFLVDVLRHEVFEQALPPTQFWFVVQVTSLLPLRILLDFGSSKKITAFKSCLELMARPSIFQNPANASTITNYNLPWELRAILMFSEASHNQLTMRFDVTVRANVCDTW